MVHTETQWERAVSRRNSEISLNMICDLEAFLSPYLACLSRLLNNSHTPAPLIIRLTLMMSSIEVEGLEELDCPGWR